MDQISWQVYAEWINKIKQKRRIIMAQQNQSNQLTLLDVKKKPTAISRIGIKKYIDYKIPNSLKKFLNERENPSASYYRHFFLKFGVISRSGWRARRGAAAGWHDSKEENNMSTVERHHGTGYRMTIVNVNRVTFDPDRKAVVLSLCKNAVKTKQRALTEIRRRWA